MHIPQTSEQKQKLFVHFAQLFCTFIAGFLGLAVLVTGNGDATVGGQVGFYFAMVRLPSCRGAVLPPTKRKLLLIRIPKCFITLPALIYLAMVPMWTRALRFANAYAYAILDVLFAIFWFAAFCALAVSVITGTVDQPHGYLLTSPPIALGMG